MRAHSLNLREKIAAAYRQLVRRQYVVKVQIGVNLSCVTKLLRPLAARWRPSRRGGPPPCQHVDQVATRRDVHRFYFLDGTGLCLDYTRRYAGACGSRRVGQGAPLRRGRGTGREWAARRTGAGR
ncbi:hypothetical protein [Hymenobacter roseosalivarius]|uniref:hypothetical protein n=1 Tax=Hymenobacter roseosalivarius TaxID=89967 RepID=UPI00117B6D56|nr:hypothetical protein [Hymenobacter roseosalivarius]